MVLKWNITIPELTGDEERRAYVYLPESYETDLEKHYPVLYMFDGHNLFFDEDATYGKCWGLKDYMDFTETPMIIAAVECNHNPDGGRLAEYSPFTFHNEKLGSISGRGRTTMNWMIHEFKPYIDEQFRTIPDRNHTFIGGSSMGGLMSLFAVLKYNHVFSRAACLSPSIWFATEKLSSMIHHARIKPDTVIYMDYGSNEIRHHQNMRVQFGKVTAQLLQKKALLQSRIVPNGDHCEASWEKQIPFFMETLLYELDE